MLKLGENNTSTKIVNDPLVISTKKVMDSRIVYWFKFDLGD